MLTWFTAAGFFLVAVLQRIDMFYKGRTIKQQAAHIKTLTDELGMMRDDNIRLTAQVEKMGEHINRHRQAIQRVVAQSAYVIKEEP